MERFFKQYDWVLNLVFIGLAAICAALIANNILASQLLSPYTIPAMPDFDDIRASTSTSGQKTLPSNRDDIVAKRCLVGCKKEEDKEPKKPCGGRCSKKETCKNGKCVPKEPKEKEPESDVPVESDLSYKLLGTVVADNPAFSQALLEKGRGNERLIAGPGTYITEKAKIIEIRRDRIILNNDNKLEFIPLEESISGNPVSKAKLNYSTYSSPEPKKQPSSADNSKTRKGKKQNPPKNRARKDKKRKNKKLRGDARKLDDREWAVNRSKVQKYLDKPKSLMKEGRIKPNYNPKTNKRDGLKITNIPPNGIYAEIGLMNGDVLKAVNGETIENQRQAIELFEKMSKKDRVELTIKRNGKKEKLKYRMR